jgi:predicted ferric reductase
MDTDTKKVIAWGLVGVNLIIICFFWWDRSSALLLNGTWTGAARSLGRLTGLLAEFFILMEIVLIARILWVERAFGFDKMNKLHRWIGYFIGILFIAHPLLLSYGMGDGRGLWRQFLEIVFSDESYLNALIALCLFIVVILSSYVIIRKRLPYETWYFTHLLTYLAIGLVFGHQIKSGDFIGNAPLLYYWLVLNYGLFAFALSWRWLRPLYIYFKHRFVVSRVVQETADVYSVYITGNKIDQYHFLPGQYANINFLAKGLWYTHPFSFSMEPNGRELRFSMKALGDFTNLVGTIKPGTKVFIDGPLGRFVSETAVTDKYIMIAGGIGVTPIRALMGSLVPKGKDVVFLYGNRTPTDSAFIAEFDALASLPGAKVTTCNVCSAMKEPGEGYLCGFIDKEKIMLCAPDYLERDVYLCGPPVMMDIVVKVLRELKIPEKQIHFEKFSY